MIKNSKLVLKAILHKEIYAKINYLGNMLNGEKTATWYSDPAVHYAWSYFNNRMLHVLNQVYFRDDAQKVARITHWSLGGVDGSDTRAYISSNTPLDSLNEESASQLLKTLLIYDTTYDKPITNGTFINESVLDCIIKSNLQLYSNVKILASDLGIPLETIFRNGGKVLISNGICVEHVINNYFKYVAKILPNYPQYLKCIKEEHLVALAKSPGYEDSIIAVKLGYITDKLAKSRIEAVLGEVIKKGYFNKQQLDIIYAKHPKSATIRLALFDINYNRDVIFNTSRRSLAIMTKAYECNYRRNEVKTLKNSYLHTAIGIIDLAEKYSLSLDIPCPY